MSTRRAAADLLVSVERGHTLNDALATISSFARLEGRDRAFARLMAATVLRRLGGLDAVLANFLARALPDSAAHARALLRLGAAQLLVLGTPAHAAVGETVAAANAERSARGFAKLINAVLRRVSTEGAPLFAALPPGSDLPPWLFARWRAAYGTETAQAIAASLRHEPPLDLTVKADVEAWAQRLAGAATPTGSVRLPPQSDVTSLDGYSEGAWWVQDAAASLPARLLGDVRGKRVIDLCAAPGGKTMQLAAAGARVTAVDISEDRLARLRENLARTRLNAEIVCADALQWQPQERADAILLDAPCTATGTLRRRPDIAWVRRPNDIRSLNELQSRLIAAAAETLKPEGTLIYAVCSLESEEGPGVASAALASGRWRRAPFEKNEFVGAAEFVTSDGDLRTLPSHWPNIAGLDGFYVARLQLAP